MATLFERLLTYLRERGLVSAGGRQRTDATHILGAVKRMGDVEVVREAVRLAIIGLMSSDAKWTMQNIPVSFIHSYQRSWPNYRMGQGELDELIQNTREEARWLLNQIAMLANIELQQLPEIGPLARIWEEQFQYVDDPERPLAVRSGKEDQTNRIRSPHDPDVTYGMKGNGALTWLGYKVHITETIEQPRFITDVRLTASSSREITDLGAIQQDLIEHQLRPTQHYVDQGSMSGASICGGGLAQTLKASRLASAWRILTLIWRPKLLPVLLVAPLDVGCPPLATLIIVLRSTFSLESSV